MKHLILALTILAGMAIEASAQSNIWGGQRQTCTTHCTGTGQYRTCTTTCY